MKFLGRDGSRYLFSDGNNAAVVDSYNNVVIKVGSTQSLLASAAWQSSPEAWPAVSEELAEGALTTLDIGITASAGRMYTVPNSVKVEADSAKAWDNYNSLSPLTKYINTLLASGSQISLPQIRDIARYFPRHMSTRDSKPVEWSAWGGDASWNWVGTVLRRVNIKSLTADGYTSSEYVDDPYDYIDTDAQYDADTDQFAQALSGTYSVAEFIARVHTDGSGIDRLYMMDESYRLYVWDCGMWSPISGIDNDITAYDMALDEGITTDITYIEVDPETALFLSACFQSNPNMPVSIFDVNQEEAQMFMDAAPTTDLSFLDNLTAAGRPGERKPTYNPSSSDHMYTPEERSANAGRQVRDSTGRFAKVGGHVEIGKGGANGSGTIVGVDNKTGMVSIKLDSGELVSVPANMTQPTPAELTPASGPATTPSSPKSSDGGAVQVDTSGILGQPHGVGMIPVANVPGTAPTMSSSDVANMARDYAAIITAQRAAGNVPAVAIAKTPGMQQVQDKLGIILHAPLATNPLVAPFLSGPVVADGAPIATNDVQDEVQDTSPDVTTPETSDVDPVFLAIVDNDDSTAVLALIALCPESSTSALPMAYQRKDGAWVADPEMLNNLKSATPPPVVPLDEDMLISVLSQIDGTTGVTASVRDADVITILWGGTDKLMVLTADVGNHVKGHVDGAEKLRLYWTVGKGGLKIRWGTPGDWTRCNRHLRKYLGPRAKGYCALRHHEMTGEWTGDHKHLVEDGNRSHHNGGRHNFSINDVLTRDEVISKVVLSAQANEAKARVLRADGYSVPTENSTGAAFKIPLVIPEGAESGDGRRFAPGAITIRELPLPLLWQIQTADGHNGSVVVGRIDNMERVEGGIGNATGFFDTSPNGQEAQRLVANGVVRWVSADLDQFEANEEPGELSEEDKGGTIGTDKLLITKARVMAATIVPKPAFQQCLIFIDNGDDQESQEKEETPVLQDGEHVDNVDPSEAAALVACGLVAGSIPVVPPVSWFSNPQLKGPTPLTVDDSGRVFGHIAAWHVDHIGMAQQTKPPRSRSNYKYFHTGVIRTDNGTDTPVGQLTLAGGHASLSANAAQAARHYDDTGSAIADVHAGEDAFGIWVSGSLRPGATPEQVRALRASAPSGDWRPINNSLELVAVCQVNVPGFPIVRARVASGAVMALVAAGSAVLAQMKSDPVAEMSARLADLEQFKQEQLLSEKLPVIHQADLAYFKVHGASRYDDTLTFVSPEKRRQLAKTGLALPDGSYPITDEDSLKNAISSYGRAKPGKRAEVRRHITDRARSIGKTDLIPDDWKKSDTLALEETLSSLRAKVEAALATFTSQETDTTTK